MRYFSEKERVDKERWVARYPRFLQRLYHGSRTIHDEFDDELAPLITPETVLLDVGCGRKGIMERYVGRTRLAVGVDLSLDALKRNRVLDRLARAEAHRLPFKDHSFDVILTQWLVEHLERPDLACAEMARVLRPGGRMLIVTNSVYHPMMFLSAVLPAGLRDRAKKRVFPPEYEEDTFTTYYRCNSARRVRRLLSPLSLARVRFKYAGDVSIFVFSRVVIGLAMLYEKITDLPLLRPMKMHILAHYRSDAACAGPRTAPAQDKDRLFLHLLACPCCRGDLTPGPDELRCPRCDRGYAVSGGIPLLVAGSREASA